MSTQRNIKVEKFKNLSVLSVILCVLCGLLFPQFLYPAPARVTGDRVNVRARPVPGSEIVTQLSMDEEVEVLEDGPEWTKIKAPVHSRCWVHGDYIGAGRIKGNSVNLRCGPGVAFPVLCQLERGAEVSIVEVAGDWVRIEPPAEFGVWVSSEYIEYPEPVEAAEEVLEEEIVEEPILPPPVPEIPATVSVSPEEIPKVELISCAGVLQDLGVIINRPGTYKLVSNEKWVCILKSPTLDLNPYVNRVVRIEGVEMAISSSWDVPVVEVKRLQVIK